MIALWSSTLLHLWQTTLVLAVLVLLDRSLRRAPARLRDRLWSAGLLKLLIPAPLLAIVLSPLAGLAAGSVEPPRAVVTVLVSFSSMVAPWGPLRHQTAEGVASAWTALAIPLTVLWAAGAAVLSGRWLLSRQRYEEEIVAADLSEALQAKLKKAVEGTGLSRDRLRLTRAPVMPALRNPWKPSLVLPLSIVESLTNAELRAVVLHEEAHLRRGDLWRLSLERVALALFFFYPPAWWLVRRMGTTAELACDEAVVGAGIEPRVYARALACTVNLGLFPAPAAAIDGGRRSLLRHRLERIRDTRRYIPMSRHKLAVAVAFALVVGLPMIPGSGFVPAAMTEQAPVSVTPDQRAATPATAEGVRGGVAEQLGAEASERQQERETFRARIRRADSQRFRLTDLGGADSRLDLDFRDALVSEVLIGIGQEAGFAVTFEEGFRDRRATLVIENTAVSEILRSLSQQTGLAFEVLSSTSLLVRAPLRVSEAAGIREPERIHYVAPAYPEEARRMRLEGFVILDATIDTEGNVTSVRVLRGIGGGLDEAAITAVKQWRYSPTVVDGRPVDVILTVNVIFQLIS